MKKAPQRKTREVDLKSELLSNSSIRVRRAVTEILDKGDRRLVPALVKQLTRGLRPFHRMAAAYALGHMATSDALGHIGGKRVVPALERALLDRNESPKVRVEAAYALGNLGRKRAIPALESALLDSNASAKVRAQAAETLAYLFANRSIPVLRRCLADRSKDVRFWCAFSLGVAGTLDKRRASSAVPALEKLAQSDNRVVRGFWTVADEARWAALRIKGNEKEAAKLERRLWRQQPKRRARPARH